MAFLETFSATSLTLFCAWMFKKYIEPRLDKAHERLKEGHAKFKDLLGDNNGFKKS